MNDDLIVHEKFLIRASKKEQDNVLAIPLIHFIHSHFDRCEIDVILDESQFNPFALLPFAIRSYFLPKEKSTIAGVHHYAYNLKEVFNVDYFIDLGGGLKEAFLGVSFKAKKRIGFSRGLQKYLLTHKVELKNNPKSDADFMLFTTHLTEDQDDLELFKVAGAASTVKKRSCDSFIFVLIDQLYLKQEDNQVWLDFFDSLVGERIALYIQNVETDPTLPLIDEDGNERNLALERKKEFVEKLDQRNKYIHVTQFDPMIFKTLALASLALVSDLSWVGVLGSYLLKESYTLVQSDNLLALEFFEQIPRWVFIKENIPYRLIGATENSDLSDMSELVDFIFAVPEEKIFDEEVEEKEEEE